jgi:hypothetical protein
MHFLRPDGGGLQVALHSAAANAVRIETLNLDHPDAPPLPGDPQTLLAEWRQKLALTLAPDGRIAQTYRSRPPYEAPYERHLTSFNRVGLPPKGRNDRVSMDLPAS